MDVAVAVIEEGGRFLIAQRLPCDSFGGSWEFPGGKCRPGETLADCLTREIQEELGMAIAVGPLLKVITHVYPHRRIRLHCFSCRVVSGTPSAMECAAWRWVKPDELTQFQFPPASQPLIEAIQRQALAS